MFLFDFTLLCSFLFYSVLFCFTLFYCFCFCSFIFLSILLFSRLFNSTHIYSILLFYFLFFSILFYSTFFFYQGKLQLTLTELSLYVNFFLVLLKYNKKKWYTLQFKSLGLVLFLNVFERSFLCAPRLHLFNRFTNLFDSHFSRDHTLVSLVAWCICSTKKFNVLHLRSVTFW